MDDIIDFGKVLNALQEGKRVMRVSWIKEGKFVFKQIHADIPIATVAIMQSLPPLVKDEFVRRWKAVSAGSMTSFDPILINTIRYRNQFCIVSQDNTINSWVPTADDVYAEDWRIINDN